MRIQGIKDVPEHPTVPEGVLVSHRGLARCTADAQVVQVARGRPQTVGYVTDRVALGKLAEHHADELAPRVITLAVLVGACCPNYFSDNFFRQFAYYLRKKCYFCAHKRGGFFGTTKVATFYLIPIPLISFFQIYLGQYCQKGPFSSLYRPSVTA